MLLCKDCAWCSWNFSKSRLLVASKAQTPRCHCPATASLGDPVTGDEPFCVICRGVHKSSLSVVEPTMYKYNGGDFCGKEAQYFKAVEVQPL